MMQFEEPDQLKKNIQVACRFRPLSQKEREFNDKISLDVSSDMKIVNIRPQNEIGNQLSFSFDKVFIPESSQKEVYEEIGKPIVESILEGFNGTILAYGQTSSGKTYTIIGSELNATGIKEIKSGKENYEKTTDTDKGLIPRMVASIFQHIQEADSKLEFTVKIGYCEIYLEKVRDLLYPSKKNLKISEDKARGVYIKDLTEEYVSNELEVYGLMKIGNKNREVADTNMNEKSSRSHAIFMVTLNQTNINDFSSRTGKLFLVDLAGSEKTSKAGSEGKRLDEAKNINKSLSSLGNVILALTDGKSTHIPYRDSKLTRILQDSLGGNSKTSLIITCSPSAFNEQETISTLRFGLRAKAVKNKPKVNKELSITQLKVLLSQANESILSKDLIIASLEHQLSEIGAYGSHTLDTGPSHIQKLNKELSTHNPNVENQIQPSENLKKDLELLNLKNSSLVKEIDTLTNRISYLILNLQESEDRLKDSIDDCLKLRAKSESQENQILSFIESNKNYEKKIEKIQEKLLKKKQKITSMQDYEIILKENQELKSRILKTENEKISALQAENQSLKQEIKRNLIASDENSEKNSSKIYSLEKNLEQLNLMYKILSNKSTTSKAYISIYEKKIARKNERITLLETNLIRAKEQANSYKYKYENFSNETSTLKAGTTESHPQHSKIKKMIKGGNNKGFSIFCPYSTYT